MQVKSFAECLLWEFAARIYNKYQQVFVLVTINSGLK